MVALAEGGTARGALVSEERKKRGEKRGVAKSLIVLLPEIFFCGSFLPPLFSFRFWSVCFSFLGLFAEKAERSGA